MKTTNYLTTKTTAHNSLAIFKVGWKLFPSRAISLHEIMREINIYDFYSWGNFLQEWICKTQNRPPGDFLKREEVNSMASHIKCHMERKLKKLGWPDANDRMQNLLGRIDTTDTEELPTAESVNQALCELDYDITGQFGYRKFTMIEPGKSSFLQRKSLFGKQVYVAFPSARNEVRAAGNCLAMDLNTAAIFHLMRVAELGMRALARELKIKPVKNTIDSAGWTEIIKHIEDVTSARWKKLPKAKKTRRKMVGFLKLCEVSTDELNVFKEIWRNNVMHAGMPYNEIDARGVFERVRGFMQRLAVQVAETNE